MASHSEAPLPSPQNIDSTKEPPSEDSQPEAQTQRTINIKVEFGGGLELLFSNIRSHTISLPSTIPPSGSGSKTTFGAPAASTSASGSDVPANIRYLIRWLKENKLTERPELFVEAETV
jgi:ubiquitin related modifier 1